MEKTPFVARMKNLVIGRSHNLQDRSIFHRISLIAFFAWVGLGADGLSSSCYGPEEAFLALGGHTYLSIFVAIGTVLTIFVICAGYSQIIEVFPSGGGGYLVASKLLSPAVGMVSGCALLVDYVLTITISIASGADAIFSLMPMEFHSYKLAFALLVTVVLMLLNMRGVKESVVALAPIFLTFLVTHLFIISYAFLRHAPDLPQVAASAGTDLGDSLSSIGLWGVLFLVLRSYSMGAGTYTGLEAVSNGIPVIREPRVRNAKRTMTYMAVSLAFVVMGLMVAYIFYNVSHQEGKTLNAILFERATAGWGGGLGGIFVLVALFSEAMLLFVAAQTGFLGGPRVLANMALDRWFPTRFATLSDRFVIQNGVLVMSALSLVLMVATKGSVGLLVVLYSINVFITFVLSQLGMVRHWWISRASVKGWRRKFLINGTGLVLCAFILVSMLIFKFYEGGWITIFITGALIVLALLIKTHYRRTVNLLGRLNGLVAAAEPPKPAVAADGQEQRSAEPPKFDRHAKTAVLLVNGFNGLGLHTLLGVIRLFGGVFKNFVFIQVGVLDAGNFKGLQEYDSLRNQVNSDVDRYVKFVQSQGFYAQGFALTGVDAIEEVAQLAPQITERFAGAVFFGGQLVFPKESFVLRFLHNWTVFALQKRLYRQGIPFVVLPIRV